MMNRHIILVELQLNCGDVALVMSIDKLGKSVTVKSVNSDGLNYPTN